MKVLVVYGTSEGQTGKVASAMALRFTEAGHDVAFSCEFAEGDSRSGPGSFREASMRATYSVAPVGIQPDVALN